MSESIQRHQLLRLLDGGKAQVPTSVGLLEFEAVADETWVPLVRYPLSEGIVAVHDRVGQAPPSEIWVNNFYQVFLYETENVTHLSFKRHDRAAIHNWRHYQQIKNEVCGPEREAVEIYPAESRLADNANQAHLWVLPVGTSIPFGFTGGFVTLSDEDVADWNEGGGPGRQEPRQPGLTVGDTMMDVQAREGASAAMAEARTINRSD